MCQKCIKNFHRVKIATVEVLIATVSAKNTKNGKNKVLKNRLLRFLEDRRIGNFKIDIEKSNLKGKIMTKQEQIEEMANYIEKWCYYKVDDGCFDKKMNCISFLAMELYNAGYRNTFTSDIASDTQKAFKEGYIKGNIDGMLLARKETVKEFAEKLKEKLFSVFGKTLCSDFDTEDITIFIDELLMEYEKCGAEEKE